MMRQIIFIGLFVITPFTYSDDPIGTQDLLILDAKALEANSSLTKRLTELAGMEPPSGDSIQDALLQRF